MKSEKTSSPDSSYTCLSTSSPRDDLCSNVDICISRTVHFKGRPGDVSMFSTLSTIAQTLPGSRAPAEIMDKMPISRSFRLCYTSVIKFCSSPHRRAAAFKCGSYYTAFCSSFVFPGVIFRWFGGRPVPHATGGFVKCSRYTTGMIQVLPWSPTYL